MQVKGVEGEVEEGMFKLETTRGRLLCVLGHQNKPFLRSREDRGSARAAH